MKKIIFSTMIACLLAFVGCQNEELVNENTNNGGEKVILTANIQGAADSRVALTYDENDEDYPVKVEWKVSGEKFKVYGYNSSRSDYYGTPTWFTQIEDTNQFEGELPSTDDGTYLAVYGDDEESINNPLQYFLNGQDGTLNDCLSINETFYLHYVLMRDIIDDLSSPIEFEHETAILKPTFKVGGIDIDNTITQIVMGNVTFPTTSHAGITEITIIPHLAEPIQSASGTTFTLNDDIYIHLPMAYIMTVFGDGKYPAGHQFSFKVTDNQGNNYTGSLTIPTGKSIEAGKFYTADIALTEACYLPIGKNFKDAVNTFLTSNASLTQIKFIADPTWTPQGIQIEESGAYMVANGTTLEIRTDAEVFMFNEKSSSMFLGSNNNNIGSRITSIDFNGCINTSNVTTLAYMFQNCYKLTSLDLSGFNTANVTSLKLMFDNCTTLQNITFGNSFSTNKVTAMDYVFRSCLKLTSLDLTGFSFNDNLTTQEMFYYTGGSDVTENRIPIKVTETGYNFLKDKTDTKIQYSNAKYVQPDGADWPASE